MRERIGFVEGRFLYKGVVLEFDIAGEFYSFVLFSVYGHRIAK